LAIALDICLEALREALFMRAEARLFEAERDLEAERERDLEAEFDLERAIYI
jgi:hypothetical protein